MTINSSHSLASLPTRPSRKSRLILIFLISLCGLFVYSYTTRLVEKSRVEAKIAEMQARIVEAKNIQYELLDELEGLNEPDYIDRVAREKFGLVKPGDTVLHLIKQPAGVAPAAQAHTTVDAMSTAGAGNLPVWQQWVHFFTNGEAALTLQ